MKVLFLLSCLEPAGSETYCVSLAEAWKGKHSVFWISDRLHHGQIYRSLPIHRKAFPMGVLNTWRVASFIRAQGIELIHSHSRRAHWVAAQAAKLTGIPHVTTIHQPPPVHVFSRLFPCLGDRTIAIDEAVLDHLRRNFAGTAQPLHLIRNGIPLESGEPSVRQAPKMKQVLLIGRLSGGRWPAFQFFLDVLQRAAPTLPPAHYKIVGQIPEERRDALASQLSIVNSKIAPSAIATLGYVNDLAILIKNSDAAIAAGRSALECLAHGLPVVLLGEGGVLGLAQPGLWPAALRTNLGDHMDPKSFDPERMETALRDLLSPRGDPQELGRWGRSQVKNDFDIRKIAATVETVYQQALPQ